MVQAFNEYFAGVGQVLADKITNSNNTYDKYMNVSIQTPLCAIL